MWKGQGEIKARKHPPIEIGRRSGLFAYWDGISAQIVGLLSNKGCGATETKASQKVARDTCFSIAVTSQCITMVQFEPLAF